MPKILGIDFIEVTNDDNSLAVPLGGIIPVVQWSTPSGTVSQDGYILCDGAIIPGGNQVTGTVPDLTTGCFLCGSTASGSAVGNAGSSVTISANQMPLHSHNGGTSGASPTNHTHPFEASAGNTPHSHNMNSGSGSYPHDHSQYVMANVTGNVAYRVDWQNDGWSNWGNMLSTKQNSNYPHNHPTGNSSNMAAATPHSHNASVGNPGSFAPHGHPVSATPEGSGLILDVKPSYYDVIYVMRVS